MSAREKNTGWIVMFAGTGINLALGVLYTWSVISKAIPAEWGWSESARSLPYSIACLVFALMTIPAGWIQDKIGPKWVAFLGGIFCGLGLIIASRSTSVGIFVVGFGILAGSGIGLGYAAATPPAVKWFPPQRTGMIAGIVVAGFGLASVYISPLANYLIASQGVQQSLFFFGVAFLLVVTALSLILRNPPAGYKHEAVPSKIMTDGGIAITTAAPVNYSWMEMLKTRQFYLLWLMYAFAAGAGLMIIAKLAKIVDVQAGVKAGFAFVALLAIGNAGGRVIAGFASDKIGRTRAMLIVFLFQAILIFTLRSITSSGAFTIMSILLGFNYGANLSLFPSITKDFYGLKNFGVNYGFVFSAWGVGGVILSYVSGWVYDNSVATARAAGLPPVGNFYQAYTIAAILLLMAAALSFLVKRPAAKEMD